MLELPAIASLTHHIVGVKAEPVLAHGGQLSIDHAGEKVRFGADLFGF